MQIIGLLVLHMICLYFLRFLWMERNEAIRRGAAMTKMGHVSKRKSPRLFRVSVWVDLVILTALYAVLIVYSVFLFSR